MKEFRTISSSSVIKNTFLLSLALSSLAPNASYGASAETGPNQPAPFFLKGAESFDRLQEALENVKEAEGVKNLLQDHSIHALSIAQRVTGDELETTQFQHYYKGIEVVGSLAFHHRSSKGADVRDSVKHFDLNTSPSVSAESAIALAKAISGDRGLSSMPDLKILPTEQGDSAQLVYWVKVDEAGTDGARQIIIDAHSGQIIGNLSEHITIAPIQIYSAKNQGLLIAPKMDAANNLLSCNVKNLATGARQTLSGAACNRLGAGACQLVVDGNPIVVNPRACPLAVSMAHSPRFMMLAAKKKSEKGAFAITDPSATRAANNSQAVLTYFLSRQNRNSYDNLGSPVVSVVHGGIAYQNAHWDTRANHMVYGDGDGKVLGDFSVALDVAGHEMTHGVTTHSARLLMMGESGALNEAYSDFFGVMISGGREWAIGKQIFLNQATAKGVRDLKNPHNLSFCAKQDPATGMCSERKPYPATYGEKVPFSPTCDGSNDNCWVHVNATIPGRASYFVVQAIGQAKAEKLYYAVLTQALGPRDDIKSAASATKKTCAHMYDASTCAAVEDAFAQVGL